MSAGRFATESHFSLKDEPSLSQVCQTFEVWGSMGLSDKVENFV